MFDGRLTSFSAPARANGTRRDRIDEAGMTLVARTRRGFASGLRTVTALALLSLAPLMSPASAVAADTGVLKRGDAAVTGFSGTRTEADVPQDVHPLDRTFIDLDGAAMRIFDLSQLGTAPRGQLSDVAPKLEIKARDAGQVFGVALDDGGEAKVSNLYVTATSMFGLQIVTPRAGGGFNRALNGSADAQWMPGQFGDKGGTPGAIYKIDGKTGAASLFATIKNDGRANSGVGLGNITFDPKTRQLFVSDLETGLIHRITLDGVERDIFDHGDAGRKAAGLDVVSYDSARRIEITSPAFNAEDSATWGFADERRRVFGLAVSMGRLYYAVSEGPAVWSVSIDDEGDFGSDPRIELQLANAPAGSAITSITFDGAGMMYLASRGGALGSYDYTAFASPEQAVVVRYRWDEKEGRWAETPEEYAIGLKPEHRSAVGGVALNYGYDKLGNIDYGKCRQTVWSTGEHLREGEDPVRVSTGGAKFVHGLQGNYKSRVRPQNEPPHEAWFTDYDGRFEDAEAFGQVGAIAIYAPCEGTAGPLVTPEVIGIDPPADNPGLIVDKRCYAGAIGGKIRCAITVRNVGDHLPVEDVKIIDVTRILAGPGAGMPIPVVSFAVPNPLIACAAAPTPDFWCTIPAALLGLGDVVTIDVWVDTHDLALAGNLGFRNCALLKHPDGFGKACAEGGTDIVVEKIGPAICLPGANCKFGLRIQNAGLMPYEGNVLLADAMFVGGASINAPITSVNPPVVCSAGDMNQLPFTCLTHLALAPGEEHIHWVEVTMPAPGNYWAENCFGALDPALIPVGPLPPGFGGGGGGNPSCVWVHVPAPKENLKITKAGTDPFEKCTKVGGDLVCKYDVNVLNENTVAYNGVLQIHEKLPAGATLTSVGAPWACGGVPPAYTCNTGGPVVIAPGGTITMPVTVSISVPNVEALMCKVVNEAKIASPAGGTPGNLDAGDDTASATEWTWGISWEDPVTHVTLVVCDPTNLKVTKKVSSPAIRSGDGFDIGYDVTITNMGPDPYKGPLKLTETFSSDVSNASFSAPFTCNGGGASYDCETGVVELAKGDSLTLKVKASVPDKGLCRLQNTAALTFPVAGSKGNGDGGDDTASATASVPSRKCGAQTLIPLPRCPDGRLRRADGTCPCPLGTLWNTDLRQCENPVPHCYDEARRKDDGTCCPRGMFFDDEYGRCRVPPQVCLDPERRRYDGTCCPFGTVVSDNTGRCVTIETACPLDTRWNFITRDCVPIRPICGPGERYNWRTRDCERVQIYCPWGTRYNLATRRCEKIDISCPQGTHWSPRKHRCVKNDDTAQCPDGSPRIAGGGCRCPLNKRWNPATGSCERPGTSGPNDPGQTEQPCPEGTHRVRDKCVKNDDTGPGTTLPTCPEGKHRVGRICIPDRPVLTPLPGDIKPIDCPKGQHRVGRLCVPDQTPGTNDDGTKSCPPGKHRVGRICVPDRPTTDDGVPKGCPDGTHRVGKRCVPDEVIKKVPKIELPKVKIRPLPPKKDPPVIRRTPQLEKYNKNKNDVGPGKVFKKFFKNQGGDGGGPRGQYGGGGGSGLKLPKAFIKIN